ncbi:hypothetical protein ES707_10664 [subsurface metagenome]
MKKYKLFSILAVILVIFFVLMSLVMGCNKTASGELSIIIIDSNMLDVHYSFSNCEKVAFAPGEYVGSGSGSGVKRYSDLEPDTEYTFKLWNNGNELLATATGKTPSCK